MRDTARNNNGVYKNGPTHGIHKPSAKHGLMQVVGSMVTLPRGLRDYGDRRGDDFRTTWNDERIAFQSMSNFLHVGGGFLSNCVQLISSYLWAEVRASS